LNAIVPDGGALEVTVAPSVTVWFVIAGFGETSMIVVLPLALTETDEPVLSALAA
jgi:hypothetical protein